MKLRAATFLVFFFPAYTSICFAFSGAPKSDPSGGSSAASTSIPGLTSGQELDSVWISRPDGGQSCSPKSGQALDVAAQELKSAGITVLESRKGNDGKMRAQMCGIATGTFNSYKISKDDLGKAQALGFKKL